MSFGNIVVSGGYYVAMGVSEVFFSDAMVIGSIGIFIGKPVFGRLFQWLGIGWVIFK